MVPTSDSFQWVPLSLTDASRLVHWSLLPVVYKLFNLLLCAGFQVWCVCMRALQTLGFVPCSFIVLLDTFSIGSQSHLFQYSVSPLQDLGVGIDDMVFSLLLREDSQLCVPSELQITMAGCVFFLANLYLYLSYLF